MSNDQLSNNELSRDDLTIGDRVLLASAPPYFKTADPMPMLRPPDVVPVGAEGMVTEQRPGGSWVVKFDRGRFLLDGQYLAAMDQSHSGEGRHFSPDSPAEISPDAPTEPPTAESSAESDSSAPQP